MSGIDNLFQEETLLSNIKIAAYFILLYEHFEDVVISTVKEFYAHDCVLNGQLFLSIDDAYGNRKRKKPSGCCNSRTARRVSENTDCNCV